ncbi:MAG TPA: inositol monophosphatase [Opitutus sp.]|nr:inositol monophosphatase [Opitutus sp.]
MPLPDLIARTEAAKRVVLAQTDLFHREFGRTSCDWKADGTRVTPVDLAISENIARAIAAEFPDDQFFSEELAHVTGPIGLTSRFAWVLDPIDGTNNYVMGIAHCAISLALLEQGRPVFGVVYDLARRKLIQGGPGLGLFDGDRPACVNEAPPDAAMLVGFHSPHDKSLAAQATALVTNFKIRGLGSSTLHLAYVAIGILGGTVDHNVKVWDIAAAVPLCLAGGGQVIFPKGEEFPLKTFDLKMSRIFYFAGNAAVCARLRKLLFAPGEE